MKPDKQLVDVLQNTRQAYRRTLEHPRQENSEWAEWWADYLIGTTDFNRLTERDWQKHELAEALNALQAAYDRQRPKHSRPHFFALRLSN